MLQILKLPEQVLGTDEVERLRGVKADDWYPVSWLLSLTDALEGQVGRYGLLRLGRRRFELSHRRRVPFESARDVIYGIEGMYRFSHRGDDIGGWSVQRFDAGYAELEKTTPVHCVMEQGILSAAFASAGCPSIVTQSQCFRDGADSCIFEISSAFHDEHWFGKT